MIGPLPLQPSDLTEYLDHMSEAEIEVRRIFHPNEALVILDIGACEGEDTIRYARCFAQARLFAFEPLPANQALMRAQFAAYGVNRATLVPAALSDRNGSAAFHVSAGAPPQPCAGPSRNYGNMSSSLLRPNPAESDWLRFPDTITVPTRTLDAFCAETGVATVDFIHMDVQGAELLVLQGATHMLPRTTAVWLEVSRHENYVGRALDRDISRFMRSRGFHLCYEGYRGDGSGEGDHFYVNLRRSRVWSYALTRRLRTRLGNLRRRLT